MAHVKISLSHDVVAHLYSLAHAHHMKHKSDEVGLRALHSMSDAWTILGEDYGVDMKGTLALQKERRGEQP